MGAFSLLDCSGSFNYYVTDNSYPGGSLVGIPNNSTVKLTLPQALTGLSYDIYSCFTLFYDTTAVGPGSYDLGPVTVYSPLSCVPCMTRLSLTSCTTGQNYTIITQDSDITTLMNTCASSCNGCQPSIYLTVPVGVAPPIAPPTDCYSAALGGETTIINMDLYGATFDGTCSAAPPCFICGATCYLVTPCNGSQQFILTNPSVVNNPSIILDTVSEITINTGNPLEFLFTGCATITELDSCSPIGQLFPITVPSQIVYGTPPVTHSDCADCFPPLTYRITRCDDSGISFVVTTDLSSVVGGVISGVTIPGCESVQTTSLCSSVKKSQCWSVSNAETPGQFGIVYTEVYPNCECCYKPCN